MATIGNFTVDRQRLRRHRQDPRSRQREGEASFRPSAPRTRPRDFRILAGANIEFGAVWKKKSQDTGREYHSVKLDDPSFPAPIYATLVEVEGEEGHSLIWSRPNRD